MPPRAASRSRTPSRAAATVASPRSSLFAPPPPEPLATSAAFAKGAHVSPILGSALSYANVVAIAICGGEVLAGVAFAAKPALWLTCFAQLFAVMSAFIMFFSVFVVGLCASFGKKMQPAGRATPPLLTEALDSVRAMWVFAGLAAWPMYMFVDGQKMGLVFSLAEAMPGWPLEHALPLYILQLVALTLVVDGYSHLKHKSMHTGFFWEFHKTHHVYRDPSPFAGFAVHPVEAFFTFVPVLGMCRPEMPVWAHAYGIWVVAWALINLYLHSGYEIPALERALAPVFINTSGCVCRDALAALATHTNSFMATASSPLAATTTTTTSSCTPTSPSSSTCGTTCSTLASTRRASAGAAARQSTARCRRARIERAAE
jgi:sterol desaturase/sphingolipid hydroxylase (fatty acid hydroxylase superfamily)